MVIARPTKREIKIIANQRKETELNFVGIVKFLYAKLFLFFLNEDKYACFLLLATPKSSIPVSLQNGRKKLTLIGGFAGFWCLQVWPNYQLTLSLAY